MKEKQGRMLITGIGMVCLLLLIIYEAPRVPDYVPDTVLFMVLVMGMFFLYGRLNLNPFSYSMFILALILHNAGAFGWYSISPIKFQWDHVTHVVSIFAMTLIIFRYMQRFFTGKRFQNIVVVLFIILAALGMGVVTEYYEFAGSFIVGQGEGGLGQGEGDIETELGNSLYLNTMLDLVYNLVGAILAVLVAFLLKYHKEKSILS